MAVVIPGLLWAVVILGAILFTIAGSLGEVNTPADLHKIGLKRVMPLAQAH